MQCKRQPQLPTFQPPTPRFQPFTPAGDRRASTVDKDGDHPPLPSPIRRVFYLSHEGTGQEHEVYPPPNPRILSEVAGADAVVYGIGSLYTSVCPSLILDGVGEAIAARTDTLKVRLGAGGGGEWGLCACSSTDLPGRVLYSSAARPHNFTDPLPPDRQIMLLNGSHDRETSSTGSHEGRMRASDVVGAVTDALNRRRARRGQPLRHPAGTYVNVIMVPRGSSVEVDRDALELVGVRDVVEVDSSCDAEGRCVYDPEALVLAIGQLLVDRGVVPCCA